MQVRGISVYENADVEEVFKSWEGDGLPNEVVEATIVPGNVEEFNQLAETYIGVDREGPGNNKMFDAESFRDGGLKSGERRIDKEKEVQI